MRHLCLISLGKDEVPGSNPGNSSNENPVITTITGFVVFDFAFIEIKKLQQKLQRGKKEPKNQLRLLLVLSLFY